MLLMLMALSTCSISWSQSNINPWDTIPGYCYEDDTIDDDFSFYNLDSVVVPLNAIRVANAKMIELKYEKAINEELREVIKIDSVLINNLSNNILLCQADAAEEVAKVKRQRNTAIGIGSGTSTILLVLLILVLL